MMDFARSITIKKIQTAPDSTQNNRKKLFSQTQKFAKSFFKTEIATLIKNKKEYSAQQSYDPKKISNNNKVSLSHNLFLNRPQSHPMLFAKYKID